jgi:hypothetical protein
MKSELQHYWDIYVFPDGTAELVREGGDVIPPI